MRYSYTKVNTYKDCPKRFELKYLDQMPTPKEASPAMERGIKMHAHMEDWHKAVNEDMPFEPKPWLEAHMPFLSPQFPKGTVPEGGVWLNKEWKPNDPFTDGVYYIMMKMDAQYEYTEGKLRVVDYKSGRRYDNHVNQLELYGAGHFYNSGAEVEAVAYYLDERPGPGAFSDPLYITEGNAARIKQEWEDAIGEIEQTETFVPRPGFYCRWCPWAKSKGGPCTLS